MKKIQKIIIGGGGMLLPFIALAEAGVTTLKGLLEKIQNLINKLIPVIIAITVLVFLWGVANYIMNAGDEEKRKESRQFIIWGLVGFVIMIGIWGLINVFVDAFGLGTGGTQIKPPTVDFR